MLQESHFNNEQGGMMLKQQSRMSSVSEGSDFVEGKSDVKINEYQAAWNVTNAIQVKKIGAEIQAPSSFRISL